MDRVGRPESGAERVVARGGGSKAGNLGEAWVRGERSGPPVLRDDDGNDDGNRPQLNTTRPLFSIYCYLANGRQTTLNLHSLTIAIFKACVLQPWVAHTTCPQRFRGVLFC